MFSRPEGDCDSESSVVRGQRNRRADPFAQFLARLEMRDVLAGQCDRIAGLGIPAGPRWAEMQGKTTEAADLDALAMGQCATHHLEQRLDREVDVLALQVTLSLGEDLDQFGLCHGRMAVRWASTNGPAMSRAVVV